MSESIGEPLPEDAEAFERMAQILIGVDVHKSGTDRMRDMIRRLQEGEQ